MCHSDRYNAGQDFIHACLYSVEDAVPVVCKNNICNRTSETVNSLCIQPTHTWCSLRDHKDSTHLYSVWSKYVSVKIEQALYFWHSILIKFWHLIVMINLLTLFAIFDHTTAKMQQLNFKQYVNWASCLVIFSKLVRSTGRTRANTIK